MTLKLHRESLTQREQSPNHCPENSQALTNSPGAALGPLKAFPGRARREFENGCELNTDQLSGVNWEGARSIHLARGGPGQVAGRRGEQAGTGEKPAQGPLQPPSMEFPSLTAQTFCFHPRRSLLG